MKRYNRKMLNVLSNCPSNVRASSPSKISSKPNCSFNLPAGPCYSCPGATKACEGCYAIRKRFLFSNVMKRTLSNWRGIRKLGDNVSRLTAKLLGVVPEDAVVYRIHSCGDFMSQPYVNAWTEVIRRRPQTKFWAFTRSFNFNYQKLVRLANFNLLASTDSFNIKEATQFVKRYKNSNVRHAYGPWEKDWIVPANSIICPTTAKQLKTDGACETCKLCIDKQRTKNVVFLRH